MSINMIYIIYQHLINWFKRSVLAFHCCSLWRSADIKTAVQASEVWSLDSTSFYYLYFTSRKLLPCLIVEVWWSCSLSTAPRLAGGNSGIFSQQLSLPEWNVQFISECYFLAVLYHVVSYVVAVVCTAGLKCPSSFFPGLCLRGK